LNGYRLKQAREILRLTQGQLAESLGVTQGTIAKLEQGRIAPSDDFLHRLILQTGFPKNHFLKPSALEFPEGSLLYRKQTKLSASDRGHIRNVAMVAYEAFLCLIDRVSFPISTLPTLEGEPISVSAALTRSSLGFEPNSPIKSLVRRLENNGVICLAVPCEGIDGFDGFSLRIEKRPIIVIDASKPPDRIRLTVAHELDHILRQHKVEGTLSDTERVANEFAGEFLLPTDAMQEEMTRPITLSQLADLKMRWGVSIQALAHRAKELDFINERQYSYLNIKIRKVGWHKKEPGSKNLPSERPRALRKLAELLYGEDLDRLARDCSAKPELLKQTIAAHDAGRSQQKPGPGEKGKVLPFRVLD